MFSTLEGLLLGQSLIIGIVLLIFAVLLSYKGLFRWNTAGFWSWVAFALYFISNPLAAIEWNYKYYLAYFEMGGGLSRGEWIACVLVAGITTFFFSYLRAPIRPVTWHLAVKKFKLTLAMKAIMIGFIGIALTSLIGRTGTPSASRLSAANARFTGDVTGWEQMGHFFFFVPVVLLSLGKTRLQQIVGFSIGLMYVVLSMQDAWGRFSIVSMILALSVANSVRRAARWPPLLHIIAGLLIAVVLAQRGHTSMNSTEDFYEQFIQIPDKIGLILAGLDTAMLASFYVESYIKDTITGYDYCLPLLNYIIFGFIPSRFFPDKYFIMDWLHEHQIGVASRITFAMKGAKSSLIGSFYSDGGILAVVLLMWIMGRLCRKIDGMLAPNSPSLVKATGISWLSMLWMIWGSHDVWGVTVIGTLAVPSIVLWLFAQKEKAR